MANHTTTTQLDLMVEIMEGLRSHHVLECKFEKRMRETQESMNWNTRGILSPYETEIDYNHFAISEGGAILSGGTNAYATLKQTMRQIWKSVNITGELARIQSQQFVSVQETYGNQLTGPELGALAANRALELILRRAAQVYTRLKNFYALNGTDSSAIATVTNNPGSNQLDFAWASTDFGSRMLFKGMKVQFYDTSLAELRDINACYSTSQSTAEPCSTVSAYVDPRASVSATNGRVTFDTVPANNRSGAAAAIAAGDTVHTVGGYGAMPQGFAYWVSDTGNLNGESGTVARSSAPDIFCSTVVDEGTAAELTPLMLLTMESYLRGRVSDDEPIKLELWMNKAQVFKYQKFGINSGSSGTPTSNYFNVTRFGDLTAPQKIDVGVPFAGLSFNNIMINEDVDVPPSKIYWVDWLGWQIDTETPDTIYEFHQNQQMWQGHNEYGEPIDAKQVTIYSQYNYRCSRFKTQGIQTDLAFDSAQIAQA